MTRWLSKNVEGQFRPLKSEPFERFYLADHSTSFVKYNVLSIK